MRFNCPRLNSSGVSGEQMSLLAGRPFETQRPGGITVESDRLMMITSYLSMHVLRGGSAVL